MYKEAGYGDAREQEMVNTNLILLLLLAKADHFGKLATPNMVGLI